MSLEVQTRLGHYRLLEKLGEGGIGVVWLARDTRLERDVALKLLRDELARDRARLDDLEREARAVAAINHPNIVTIYSIEEDEGRRYITMELLRGGTLAERIPAEGLPHAALWQLAVPLCDALGAAHEHGIAHRDLKPRNVMFDAADHVKILDFGLACFRSDRARGLTPDDTTVTHEGGGDLSGTLAYMAPEQLRGGPVDHRADIFALGLLLYEAATGRHPFRRESPGETVAAILRDPAPRPRLARPELPRAFERLVLRCLEKLPELRPQRAADLRDSLSRLARETEDPSGEPRSIAVLPFADTSAERDQDYFCEGIAEEIINALSRLRGLRVVSRTSAFQFKQTKLDSREIGARLGVDALLEGAVRKSGDRLRITAELIDVVDGCHLWSERYDRELKDVFAIQDEIAQKIAGALRGRLSPSERRALRHVATADPRAYEYYLRGRQFHNQYGQRGVEFALRMFERAIEIDPDYALAWAGVADCCAFLYANAGRSELHRRRAEESSRRALELDPDSAEARTSRAVTLSTLGRHEEAEREFRAAETINPRLFEAFYFHARDAFAQGKSEEAIRLYEQAAERRPEDYQGPLLVAQIYDDLGRADEATESRRRGVRLAEARLDLNPDDVRALYMGANGLVALGERETGLAWARRAREVEPNEPMLLYNLACIQALAEEREAALDCLERALDFGFAHTGWIAHDSNLDGLRGEPRFRAILSRLAKEGPAP